MSLFNIKSLAEDSNFHKKSCSKKKQLCLKHRDIIMKSPQRKPK